MEKEEAIVLFDSEEAATYRTDIKGWVSRNGLFYGDKPDSERLARWEGSTHTKCEKCGKLYPSQSWCSPCYYKAQHEEYLKMPKKKWDGGGAICCDGDRYFWSIEEAEDYAADNNQTLADLDLVICKPQYAWELDPDDTYIDILPEDQSLNEIFPELYKKLQEVNEIIRSKKTPISWTAGKYRLDLD